MAVANVYVIDIAFWVTRRLGPGAAAGQGEEAEKLVVRQVEFAGPGNAGRRGHHSFNRPMPLGSLNISDVPFSCPKRVNTVFSRK